MRKAKASIALLLVILLIMPANIGQAVTKYRYEDEAYKLHKMGLYEGTSTAYFSPDLGSTVERQVAVILLLKMFGKKSEVEAMTKAEVDSILSKYTDQDQLAPWCRPYMAYGVKHGMVAGTSKTTLGPKVLINGVSFACLILKNLGYTFTPETFVKALELLSEKGGITSEEAAYFNKPVLIKDDIVGIIYGSMRCISTSGKTLVQLLIENNAMSMELASAYGLLDEGSNSYIPPVYQSPNLSEEEILYLIIKEAMLEAAPSVKLPVKSPPYTSKEIFEMVERVSLENPGILYHSSSTYYSSGLLEFTYTKDGTTARAHYEALEQKATAIIQSVIKPGMSDYEKELAIHNYIINHSKYDVSALSKGSVSPESFTAYGVLVLGKGVCEAYAEAFKYLMDKVGIPCSIVVGTSHGSSHAWNIVNLEESYYQVDLTWDDPVMEDGSDVLTHVYFNLPDSEMAIDHIWDRSKYPLCTSDTYNYYVYNNLVMETSGFVDFVVGQAKQGKQKITVKVSDFKSQAELTPYLVSVANQLKKRLSYMVTDEFGIVDITIN